MTFRAILIVAILAADGFSFLEWQRANRLHLAARLAATILAVAALALLGLRPTWQPRASSPPGGRHALLWTPPAVSPPGAAAFLVPPGIDARHRFALPDAVPPGAAATPIPDAAFLRRRFPEIGTLHLLGDGLDPSELDSLRGLRVEFDPTASSARAGLFFLRCPRELNLGAPLIVQGQLGGLVPSTRVTLTLAAPDGVATDAASTLADAAGDALFTLRAAPLPSGGHFIWRLRTPAANGHPATELPLGVAVVPPDLPRLLILEGAPRFDTAALRRWFGAAGGTLVARTQMGQERYQSTSASAVTPPPFTALTPPLLAGFDLLLADASSLAALPSAERDVLLAAVADTGLGVLMLPDEAPLPPAAAATLFPWKLSALTPDPAGGDRTTRLQWPGQTVPTDHPVPSVPFEIVPGLAQRPLLGDRQGHTLAATEARGRGQLAVTLVRDTARWQRENDPAAFAAYWSFLFSRLARPADDTAGRWALLEGDAGPVFVDHPLTLLWSGPAAKSPGPARVSSPSASAPTTLALAPDPAEPGRWRATFWPRRPGWHRVLLASGGPALDFYVSTTDAWPALAAERRRAATVRFAEASATTSSILPAPPATREEIPPVWLAALFFLSAGYLWIERRFAA